MTFGFLGIGALYEDTLLSLPWYPTEDHKLRATGLTTRVGGNIPNTLGVLSQVVVPVDRLVFVSVYAEKTSVEVNGIWRDCPENPRSWILRSEKTGSRTIVNYNGVEEFTSDELVHELASLKDPEDITWVHFEGRIPDILLNAIPQIRPLLLPHATISIECEKPDRPGLMELLPLADVIFFSHTYFIHFQSKHSGSDASTSSFFSFMRAKNSHAIFIVTTGADGALYSIPGEEGTVPTSQVELVDSTGAGDTFIAGFVWARGKLGKSVKESVQFAVALATKKVAQEGFDGVWNERER